MRIRPPAPGEPFYNEQAGPGIIRIANREPDEQYDFEAREIIDAGFLELVRYGIRRADDPLIIDSLKVVDHILKIETPFGTCWRRYNHDGYGQKKDGGPYDGWGQGRAWPLLTGERAPLRARRRQRLSPPHIAAIERFSSIGGMLPEQIWDHADIPSAGLCTSAAPPAPPNPSSGPTPSTSSSSAPPSTAASSTASPSSSERYAVPPGQRTFKSQSKSSSSAAPSTTSPLASPSASSTRTTSASSGPSTTGPPPTPGLQAVGYPGSFADIPTTPSQTGTIIFTLFWPADDHWLGRNISLQSLTSCNASNPTR